MNNKESIHMSINEFKENGYKVIDWIADYYENIESYPVLSQINPGDLRKALPKEPPKKGDKFDIILDENYYVNFGNLKINIENFMIIL